MGLLSLEKLGLVVEKYSETKNENEREDLLYEAATLKNRAIDLTRDAINISPYTYENWSSRSTIFIGFVGLGLQDYYRDALYTLEKSTELKPLDYESYFKKGQIYMLMKGDHFSNMK
jgi:hypothetical protein